MILSSPMSFPALTTQEKMMTEFQPFRAWRYNTDQVSTHQVIAPPYDVISPEEQKDLYARSPYNCVRLILNQIEPADDDHHNRYTRARDFYLKWQREGILIRDKEPSFYLYRQVFAHPASGHRLERTALLGRLRLEPFEKGVVIPHEKTLSKPRADRRKLLEATETNFSPVFGLYEDFGRQTASVFEAVMGRKPILEAVDDQKVSHTVWPLGETPQMERIHEALSHCKIYIADGHHRYQTALEYAADRRKQLGPSGGERPWDYVLMALVAFQDPGLVLLPTHRIVLPYPGFSADKALDALRPFFKFEKLPVEEIHKRLKAAQKDPSHAVFGLCLEKESFFLTLQDEKKMRTVMPAGKPGLWYQLDLNILTYGILQKLWDLSEGIDENTLRFTRYEDEAVSAVQTKKAQAAFLLKAPSVKGLRDMGEIRELMPQKSTYFYPKLASGLVFYPHRED